jgi:hypothetical protein
MKRSSVGYESLGALLSKKKEEPFVIYTRVPRTVIECDNFIRELNGMVQKIGILRSVIIKDQKSRGTLLRLK